METIEGQVVRKTNDDVIGVSRGGINKNQNPGLKALLSIKNFNATLEKDAVVLDIGANIGETTLHFARLASNESNVVAVTVALFSTSFLFNVIPDEFLFGVSWKNKTSSLLDNAMFCAMILSTLFNRTLFWKKSKT